MNDFIKKINQRVSIRDFDETKKLTKKQKKILIDAVNNAPTSSNNQYFGCVFIEDKKIIAKLASNGKFQNHLSKSAIFAIFFIENYRLKMIAKKSKEKINSTHLQLLTTGTIDATIAAAMLQDAAISLGLGTCWIGAVRQYPKAILTQLKLPKENVPIVGMSIGFSKTIEKKKPKINKVYQNFYDHKKAIAELNDYNEVMLKYYLKRSKGLYKKNYFESAMSVYKNGEWDKDWCELVYNTYPKLKEIK